MNTHIEDLVDRIFNHLRQLGSTLPSKRRSGLNPGDIKETMSSVGLDAHHELIGLYACCDGTATQEGEILGDLYFLPGFYWMSLNDALETYYAVSKNAEWGNSWLPIFANGGGDFYAVVCNGASPYFGEIVGFVLGEPDQIAEFRGVASLLETIERSFATGAFSVSEGRLKADYSRMRTIAREVQPDFLAHEV